VSTKSSKRILAVTLALLAASQLAGCGGGGGGGGGNSTPPGSSSPPPGGGGNNPPPGGGGNDPGDSGNNPPTAELNTGTFVDAPVAGLSYTTSSDINGITDADGRYNYRPGDTVTFSIGNLVLGTVPGQGVVTPMTVANALVASTNTDPGTVAVNLLVLLQSLDSNGNPDDGITFTPAIRDAVASNSIDLTASESAFTAALSTFVSSVSGASGVSLTPVDRTDAVNHFTSQAPGALAGVYVRADADFAPITQKIVTLAMFRNGNYLLGGQYDNAECNLGDSGGTPKNDLVFSDARGNGVEYGAYVWNPLTQAFSVNSASVSMETNGFCGFNAPIVGATNDTAELEITAQGLVFRDSEGNVTERFARLESGRTGIGGAWIQPSALMSGQPFMFSMFPSSEDGKTGRYLMVDASLPTAFDTSPGIEEGCYSIDANNNLTVELNSTLCPNAIDTNDTAGISDASGAKAWIDENDRLVFAEGSDVVSFARLPVETPTHAKLAGAWVIESEPGVELGDQENLALLTIFEDGRFLFGTQQNDASCVPVDYPNPTKPLGNGVEYGALSLTSSPGLVTPVDVTEDSNGECGLFDATKGFQQRYFVVPNAAGDALAVWANDEEDPAGFVFKRVPSVPNEITGAWLWSEGVEDEFAVVAYFPSGVMFEVALFSDFSGLLRESFTMNGNTMTSQAGGYEYCVDTQNDPSENGCLNDDPIVEEYIVQGDTMIDDDESGSMTRIAAP